MSAATTASPKVDWSCPSGRLVLRSGAPRSEWLAARHGGVGGSDVATLAGVNRYLTPFELWQEKTSDTAAIDEPSEAMWWGQHTEALTVERFETETSLTCRRAGTYAHRLHDHHRVNVDRLVSDGGVLEVKDHELLSVAGRVVAAGEVTDAAAVQLQWACHVLGRSHGWFAAKVGKRTVVLGPVARDDDVIAQLVDLADAFWDCVQGRVPPPIDPATVTGAELAIRFPEATPETTADAAVPFLVLDDLERLRSLKKETKALADERDSIEGRLKSQIGDQEFLAVDGRPVARWQTVAGRTALDTKALDADHPNLREQYLRRGAPTRRLTDLTEKER